MSPRLILFNKPCGVLSQFTDAGDRPTLADYMDIPRVYPAGRLDRDSEGLLVLTDHGALQARISSPRYKVPKQYLAQVEGEINPETLTRLARGVVLKDGPTRPARAEAIPEPDWLWPREPPVRFRKSVPTSWLLIELREGRNRQVRRMTAAVGFPTLRLIRTAVGPWQLGKLAPGQWLQADPEQIAKVAWDDRAP